MCLQNISAAVSNLVIIWFILRYFLSLRNNEIFSSYAGKRVVYSTTFKFRYIIKVSHFCIFVMVYNNIVGVGSAFSFLFASERGARGVAQPTVPHAPVAGAHAAGRAGPLGRAHTHAPGARLCAPPQPPHRPRAGCAHACRRHAILLRV